MSATHKTMISFCEGFLSPSDVDTQEAKICYQKSTSVMFVIIVIKILEFNFHCVCVAFVCQYVYCKNLPFFLLLLHNFVFFWVIRKIFKITSYRQRVVFFCFSFRIQTKRYFEQINVKYVVIYHILSETYTLRVKYFLILERKN